MRSLFMLNPEIIFLNHGSFGACPRPVFEVYQEWQKKLEWQPVEFLGRKAENLLLDALAESGNFLHCSPENLIFVPNVTTGVNLLARSLSLNEGDEILTTDHEYGAMNLTWQFIAKKTGARYIQQPIPLPVTDPDSMMDTFWQGVTDRTRVIFISHITSPTSLIFPVEKICQKAREARILTIVDGAHAPGQIPLNLEKIGADFYVGNCHKWLCAPKGAGFLYARPEHHHWLEPLVISWGWSNAEAVSFQQANLWQGTRDIAAFLSVPAAIQFQHQNHPEQVCYDCHLLARFARHHLSQITDKAPIMPDANHWFAQMITAPLPDACDIVTLKNQLFEDYHIEIPLIEWNGGKYIRVSVQSYNTREDIDRLIQALEALLKQNIQKDN